MLKPASILGLSKIKPFPIFFSSRTGNFLSLKRSDTINDFPEVHSKIYLKHTVLNKKSSAKYTIGFLISSHWPALSSIMLPKLLLYCVEIGLYCVVLFYCVIEVPNNYAVEF